MPFLPPNQQCQITVTSCLLADWICFCLGFFICPVLCIWWFFRLCHIFRKQTFDFSHLTCPVSSALPVPNWLLQSTVLKWHGLIFWPSCMSGYISVCGRPLLAAMLSATRTWCVSSGVPTLCSCWRLPLSCWTPISTTRTLNQIARWSSMTSSATYEVWIFHWWAMSLSSFLPSSLATFHTLHFYHPAYLHSALHAHYSTHSIKFSDTNLLSIPFAVWVLVSQLLPTLPTI